MSAIYACLGHSAQIAGQLFDLGARQVVNGVRFANERGWVKVGAAGLAGLTGIWVTGLARGPMTPKKAISIFVNCAGAAAIGFECIRIARQFRQAEQRQLQGAQLLQDQNVREAQQVIEQAQRAQELMQRAAPEAVRLAAPEAAPEAVHQAGPEAAYQAAYQAALQAAQQVGPEAALQVALQVAQQIAPQSAFQIAHQAVQQVVRQVAPPPAPPRAQQVPLQGIQLFERAEAARLEIMALRANHRNLRSQLEQDVLGFRGG